MNDVLAVRGIQPGGDLLRDVDRFSEWNRSSADSLRQGFSVDQLEDQRRDPVLFLDAINCGDVRMIDGGQRARFAIESRESIVIGLKPLRQNLDGDVTTELGIAGCGTPRPSRLRPASRGRDKTLTLSQSLRSRLLSLLKIPYSGPRSLSDSCSAVMQLAELMGNGAEPGDPCDRLAVVRGWLVRSI